MPDNKIKPPKLRHLKSVTEQTANSHMETLSKLRSELDKQIEKKKKTGRGRIWQGFQDTLYPYAKAMIKEYEDKGYKVKETRDLNMVMIELFDAEPEK